MSEQNWYLQALHLVENNAYEEAQSLIHKIAIQNKKHVDSQILLAEIFEKQNQEDQALKIYEFAIQNDPNSLTARLSLGNFLFKKKHYEKALEQFQKALHLNKKSYEALFALANCYRKLSLNTKAIKAYYRCLYLEPNFCACHINLANTLREERYSEDAFVHYKKALKLEPSNPTAQKAFASFAAEFLLQILKEKGPNLYEQSIKKVLEMFKQPGYFYRYFQAYLLGKGLFNEGFQIHRHRVSPSVREQKKTPFPKEPFTQQIKNKNILLIKEQGIGDLLFFLRFAPALLDQGAQIFLLAPERIEHIFEHTHLFAKIGTKLEDFPDMDYQCLVGDLPFLTQNFYKNFLPPPFPLTPKVSVLKNIRDKLAPYAHKQKIAISWRKGLEEKEESFFKEFVHILKQKEALYIGVQQNSSQEEIRYLQQELDFIDFSHTHKHVEQLLGILFLSDHYVGFSNTSTHFKASFNHAFDVFVPFPSSWYWAQDNEKLFWFPKAHAHYGAKNESWQIALKSFETRFLKS